jgi:putative hydrolase of the HAD superfamily
MIKALLFDLGDVIIGLDFERAYRKIEGLSRYKGDEIPDVIRRARLADPYERGELSNREFHAEYCRTLDLDIGYPEFEDLWADVFQPEPLLPDALFETLGQSRRLVLVSNTNEIHFNFIQRQYAVLRHFDDFVLSYRIGSMKPSPEIYQEAVRSAGCSPAECFFTDDKQENVDAARRAGIDAIRFEGRLEIERQLKERGLL